MAHGVVQRESRWPGMPGCAGHSTGRAGSARAHGVHEPAGVPSCARRWRSGPRSARRTSPPSRGETGARTGRRARPKWDSAV